MLNIPNILTILRILLVPSFMAFMYSDIPHANQWAFLCFAVAASTDFLDGHIARKYKLVTNLGKIIDPVADKILVTAALVVLVEQQKVASWIVVLMLLRDFSVGALRDVAASQGTIIAAGVSGKLKTLLQVFALGFLIFYDRLIIWPIKAFGIFSNKITVSSGYISIPSYSIGSVLIYIALAASIVSGIIYFAQFKKVFQHIDK